jgi:hypothetical protein
VWSNNNNNNNNNFHYSMTLLPPECVLSISNARNSEDIVRQLNQESTDQKEGLILRRVVVTPPVCIALSSILRHRVEVAAAEGGEEEVASKEKPDDESSISTSAAAAAALSSWKRVELRNIEGDFSSAISTCMTWNVIEELRIVMNAMIPPHPVAWLELSRGIQVNTKLTCLRITVEWIGRGMKELAVGLASPSCVLKVLDLSWSYWEDETDDITPLGTSTPSITTATSIDPQEGTETQVEGTAECSSRCENDGDSQDNSDRNATVTMELARGLRDNTTLKVLRLAGCRLRDDQLQTLVDALRCHPTLRTMDLNGNKAGSLTSQAVARLLAGDGGGVQGDDHSSQRQHQQSSQLASLDISFQNSRVPNARLDIAILASALRNNTCLQVLDLSNDGITDQDLDVLCHAFAGPSTTGLRELELTRNKITDQGMITLSGHLRTFRQLKRLSIWGNPFEDIGAKALADALLQNVSLEHVELFRTFSGSSEQIAFYTNLNRAGRQLLVLDDRSDCTSRTVVLQGKNPHSRPKHPSHVPLALWPFVLGRIDRIPLSNGSTCTHLDMLYYMVRWGPALLHSR